MEDKRNGEADKKKNKNRTGILYTSLYPLFHFPSSSMNTGGQRL